MSGYTPSREVVEYTERTDRECVATLVEMAERLEAKADTIIEGDRRDAVEPAIRSLFRALYETATRMEEE